MQPDYSGSILKAVGLTWEVSSYVDGRWLPFDGSRVDHVEDPATATVVAEVLSGGADEVDQAARAAHRAYREEWSKTTATQRGVLLAALGARLQEESEPFARLESLDTGKPLSQARGDVMLAARYFSFYAAAADQLSGDTIEAARADLSYTVREPFGVVAQIIPWNSPISQLARGVAAALAAGNTVVLKPSELAPLSSLAFAELSTRAGLPAGVLNVVAGTGTSAGQPLARHPLVRQITFTGSVESGRRVLEASATHIVPCTLELGGKSPALVFEDADLTAAAAAAVGAIRRNSGQSCSALTRFLVHERVHDELLGRILSSVSKLRIGPGLLDLDLGPLVSAVQLERVQSLVSGVRDEGAAVACGGSRPAGSGLSAGHFFAPTVLTGVSNSMTAARQEIFGPVQSLITFTDEDEAVSLANDSDYGLCAAIFTRDFARAHRLTPQLEAGQVHINEYPLDSVETPFGGFKASGIGREKGLQALEGYTQLKTILARVEAE
ncbi:MAG TPA: aldehyde dehydrogenase family protein [Trebonia sp.]|nr:aldehyde dehydrogenase family protein [Trebonia sp.]